ncbi:50S ribosomal protein L21 [bacterium]|nr:50S ribosomal protein L21 [bacterium]MBU1880447.1 50S ribosomal protein L21 [bacterium]
MYAIAKIAGKQFRLEPKKNVKVPLLDVKEGSAYTIDDILFAVDSRGAKIDDAALKGIKANAKVVLHGRDKKVIVFKKKRRQGFKVTKGHRQDFTLLEIESLEGLIGEAKKAETPKQEAKPKAKPKKKAADKPKKKPAATKGKKPAAKAKPKAAPKKKAKAKPKAEEKNAEKPVKEEKPAVAAAPEEALQAEEKPEKEGVEKEKKEGE